MPDSWAVPDGLPPGRLIVPDPRYGGDNPVTDPALWVTDEPADGAGELFARLLREHPATGLWPLLLTTLQTVTFSGPPSEVADVLNRSQRSGRPWHTGELSPTPAAAAEGFGAAEILEAGWNYATGQGPDGFDFGEDAVPAVPFRSWPGLAEPGPPGPDPVRHAAGIATALDGVRELTGRDDRPYLGLVPAADGAGTIIACGWMSGAGDPAEIAAVVASWQDRFGARLCSLGFDALAVSVARPPATIEHARHIAAEHFGFCADLAESEIFDDYARTLIGGPVWRFWWD